MRRALAFAITCCTACRIGFTELPSDGGLDAPADLIAGDARIVTHTFGERAGSMTTGVTTDTSLSEMSPMLNNGASEELSIIGTASFRRRILLRFDLSSIPAGTPILAARIELELIDLGDNIVGDLALRVSGQPWVESTATWNVRDAATAWTFVGGTVSAIVAVIPAPTGAFTVPVPVNIPQSWIDAPLTNFGVVITAADETTDTHYHVHASESLVVTARPLLVLDLAE